MAVPDIRPEDLSVKATILTIAINRTREAIRSFVIALNCDETTSNYKSFKTRMDSVLSEAKVAYMATTVQPLPFDIGDSSLALEWAKLKTKRPKS